MVLFDKNMVVLGGFSLKFTLAVFCLIFRYIRRKMEIIWWHLWVICKYMSLIYLRNGHYCCDKSAVSTCRALTSQVPCMGTFPGYGHHLEYLGCDPKCSSCGNVNLIILWNVTLVSCWGHKSQPRALPALAQSFCPWQDGGQRGSPTHREVPRSLFKKRNQPLEESQMEGALPRATPTVAEHLWCNSLAY